MLICFIYFDNGPDTFLVINAWYIHTKPMTMYYAKIDEFNSQLMYNLYWLHYYMQKEKKKIISMEFLSTYTSYFSLAAFVYGILIGVWTKLLGSFGLLIKKICFWDKLVAWQYSNVMADSINDVR